jgi:hypothetical protein
MKEIQAKILELLTLSNTPIELKDFDALSKKMKEQDDLMNEISELSKKNKTILGRTVSFPVADGSAIYIITKINKKTVRLTWIDYCDGYADRQFGREGGNYSLEDAQNRISFEDKWSKM